MPDRWLLIADPPHGDAKVPAVATRLKLLALEVRGRLGYAIPEPWLVFDTEAPARELEKDLRALDVSCVAARAGDLARVPAAVEADTFELPEQGIAWAQKQGARGGLAWSQIRTVVVYRRVTLEKAGPSD